MTRRTYLEYEPEEEDNQTPNSTLVTRFPPNWSGDRVNNSMGALASALRNLGDMTLFAPMIGEERAQVAGSIVVQDSDDVNLTGGIIDGVRGSVPIGTTVLYGLSWETYVSRYTPLLNYGWVIADGRTVINPTTGEEVTTPQLVGRTPRFASTDTLQTFGSDAQTSTINGGHAHGGITAGAGSHSHGGATAGHSLTEAELAPHTHTYSRTTGSGGTEGSGPLAATTATTAATGSTGSGAAHAHGIITDGEHNHGIFSDGAHSHTVNVQMASVKLIPLIRVW